MIKNAAITAWVLMVCAVSLGNAAAKEGDPADVAPVWEHVLGGRVAGGMVADGDTLLVGAGDHLYGLNQSGQILWQWPLRGTTLSRPVITDTAVFVHTDAGLTAYDRDGAERWHVASEDRGPLVEGNSYWGWGEGRFEDPWALYRSTPAVQDGMVFFGDTNGVHAVRAADGGVLWSRNVGAVTADIALYGGNLIVGSWDNRLYSLDAATGADNWVFAASLPFGNSPEWSGWKGFHVNPVVDGDTIYAGTRGTFLYAVNAADGSVRFAIKHGTSWIGSPALVEEESFLFALSDGKGVQGHGKRSSNQLFFEPLPGPAFAAPVRSRDVYLVATLTGEIVAFEPVKGTRRMVRLHQEEGHYYGYFAPDRFAENVSPHQRAVQGLADLLEARNGFLSLAVIGDMLIAGTGSGKVLAYRLTDIMPAD